MSKHTPGPWRIGDAGTTIFGPSTDQPCPVTIAKLIPATPRCGAAERKANKLLMVAAPDMLKAMQELVQHIESLPDDTDKCRHLKLALNNRAGDMVRAAIAKATGETNE